MKEIQRFLYKAFIGSVLFLSISCYKDKGNYDLNEINEVSFVDAQSDTIFIQQFDTVSLSVDVEQTFHTSSDNLEYKWSVYYRDEPITGGINELLSEEKDLHVPIGLTPNRYWLLYTVTDRETGVSIFKKFYLEVSSSLSEGWLVISEDQDNQRDVDILHPDGYSIQNIFSAANLGNKLPKGAHTVKVLTTFFGGSQDIYILSEEDGVRVSYIDFAKLNGGKDWYIQVPATIQPKTILYDQIGFNAFYVDGGNAFSGQIDFRYGAPMKGDWEISQYIFPFPSSSNAVVFDKKNQRFMSLSGTSISRFSSDGLGVFDINNVGMDVIYGAKGPNNLYQYLMKDAAGAKYILQISTGGDIAVGKFNVNNAEKLEDASHYAFSSLYLHMYYAVGNKVYLLDIGNNESKLVYSFPEGEEVTAFTLKKSSSDFVGFPDNNRTLAVGTYNGDKGRVYTFSINNTGSFNDDSYELLYDDLNRPVALEYKNRK